jgi:drug/metabolite transporter (DMT)-like permease
MIDFLSQHVHALSVAAAIVLTGISQLLLRQGARRSNTALRILFNPITILGYALFAGVVLLLIFAMQRIPLRTVIAWNSLTFVLTPFAGWLVLDERLTPRMAAGAMVIVLGVVVFSV